MTGKQKIILAVLALVVVITFCAAAQLYINLQVDDIFVELNLTLTPDG